MIGARGRGGEREAAKFAFSQIQTASQAKRGRCTSARDEREHHPAPIFGLQHGRLHFEHPKLSKLRLGDLRRGERDRRLFIFKWRRTITGPVRPFGAPQNEVKACLDDPQQRQLVSSRPINRSITTLNPADIVDPVDVEECLQRKNSTIYDHTTSVSPARKVHEFPLDDIDVRIVHRDKLTESSLTENLNELLVEPQIRDLIDTYNDQFSLVQRRHQQYSSADAYIRMLHERPILAQTLPRQNYELDIDVLDANSKSRAKRSASVVDDQQSSSKRNSFASHYSSDSMSTVDAAQANSQQQPTQLHQSVSDPTIPGVIQRISHTQLDQINEQRRNSGRSANLVNLLPIQNETEVVERRTQPPFPAEYCGQKLVVKFNQLQLEPVFEPLFGSVVLYDIKSRRRISEVFHFDFNTDELKRLVSGQTEEEGEASKCRQGIFSLSDPSADVFIVIKLDKVLQGCESSEAAEPYIKEDKEKNRDKLSAAAKDYCERLGAYRMPLGWMFIDLSSVLSGLTGVSNPNDDVQTSSVTINLDAESIVSADRASCSTTGTFRRVGSGTSGSGGRRTPMQKRRLFAGPSSQPNTPGMDSNSDHFVYSNASSDGKSSTPAGLTALCPVTLNFDSFFRHESDRLSDEDILKILNDARRQGSKFKSLRTFPAKWKVELSTTDDLLMKYSPELLKVNPFVPGPPANAAKEVAEFPHDKLYAVNASYRNLLYIYPKIANFSNRAGAARNICIKVELMDAQEVPLGCFFGKSSAPNFSTKALTVVNYHNKCPQFTDELKIRIPVDLNDGHHLLFTFYHVACRPSKPGEESETLIGYSWIPLFKDGRLQTGDFHLPISLDKLPQSYGYLASDVNLPNIRWLDGHKPLFSVSLRALSTVHTQDQHLDQFLRAFHSLSSTNKKLKKVTETELKSAIHSVAKARPQPMVSFLYVILDKLLALITSTPFAESISIVCFEMIGQLVKICTMLLDSFSDSHGRSSLLSTYIHYHKISLKDPLGFSVTPSTSQSGPNAPKASFDPEEVHSPLENSDLFEIIRDFERSASTAKATTFDSIDGSCKNHKLMHEELVRLWVTSTGAAREMAFINSWFFLELILKSMAEYLSVSNRMFLPRKLRFRDCFIKDLNKLAQLIVHEILEPTGKGKGSAAQINLSYAFFLRDCFSLADRSYVMTLVKQYNRDLSAKISSIGEPLSTSLMLLKMDFMRVVCSHEHFVMLNIPFGLGSSLTHSLSTASYVSGSANVMTQSLSQTGTYPPSAPNLQPPSPGGSSLSSRSAESQSSGSVDLTPDFRSKHFLIGIVLSDLASVLETSSQPLHSRAIGLIRNLLATHEADSRLSENVVKNRVAGLYLPLVGIVLDCSTQLYDPYSRPAKDIAWSQPIINGNDSVFSARTTVSSGPGINPKVALAIAGMGNTGSPPTTPNADEKLPQVEATRPMKSQLSLALSRQLLACFCWVLKHLDRTTLRHWMRELSPGRMVQLLDVLQLAISCFEYRSPASILENGDQAKGELRQRLEDAILGENSMAKEFLRKKSAGLAENDGVRWRKDTKVTWKGAQYNSGGEISDEFSGASGIEIDSVFEATLCTEVSLTVLDTLELVLKVINAPGSDHLLFALPIVLKIFMHALACNQSVTTLDNVFASQRAVVVKYPELIFEQQSEQCGELCLQLLRHCASKLPQIRSQAAASLYLLMRQSFECGSNLAKVKMQITMSLSTLVSNGTKLGFWLNEDHLRRSLKTVLTYSETDAHTDVHLKETTFTEQVKDLVFNLHMILSDTVKMKDFSNDFEMLIDLMYRVAKGYQNNPDLRLTWLLNMAGKHSDKGNYAEAGQCVLHAAALAAEYLAMTDYREHLPKGAVAFETISENVIQESATSDDVISPDEEGICESAHFSEVGLVNLIEKTAMFFEKAQMYEQMLDIFKVLSPVLEEWRDYQRLSQLHNRISVSLSKIEPTVPVTDDLSDAWVSPLQTGDKRCFGTYFRVAFYGSIFGDLDGVEFVYKEPAITKLPEISHRLDGFYSDRFGKGVIEVIKDSNTVDRAKLNQNKGYLQITYVEPYLEGWERRRRPTYYERNHKLHRFVYATPFTKDGRAHGELQEQYKRRTVLTTQHSFPYVKTRLRVIKREQTVLAPIEVAIEDVQKKTRELAAATAQNPPDAKMLQMVLQGCIGTTVNQGPIQVANVFLAEIALDEHGKPVDKLQNKLRLCFKDFSKKCHDALLKNEQLIHFDQADYQKEMKKNYVEFTKLMAPIVSLSKFQPRNRCSSQGTLDRTVTDLVTRAVEMGPVTAV
ncbi:hypothetical protein L596_009672 [Steinernema carpocapsae]|uniref:C2 DOCK-type domain-containing protein n=1 Tax=Steinernema carpocapsae TaxID=34508 RepID=A0A4U5PGU6_STECR|nr:hypothetical protein L596_009672 [Steinernema carpocapsae]